jgi:putative peptide zinc metalloprotease protein
VLTSVPTVLFNANPLMRFDGYYLLSDWLDIPNLYGKGQKTAGWIFRRWFLGMRKAEFPLRPGEPFPVIAAYGLAAWVWKTVVFIGIALALAVLFEGAGLLLALALLAVAALQAILSAVKYLRKSAASEGLRPVRLFLRLASLAGLATLILFAVEVTPSVRAPAVVRDVGGGEIRASCPGFLKELKVAVGDRVAKGDVLARLENAEEEARLAKVEIEIRRARLRHDALVGNGEIAAALAEQEHLDGLEETARELRGHVASLELRAPRDGTIDARHLELLVGTWIEAGRLLFSVVEENRRELVILASANDREPFEQSREADRPVIFHPRGRLTPRPARLEDSVPKAGIDATHFALITPAGGALPVRRRSGTGEAEPASGTGEEQASQYELTEPRFEFRAALSEEAGDLREGEIGMVTAHSGSPATLAELAWKSGRRSIDRILSTVQNR